MEVAPSPDSLRIWSRTSGERRAPVEDLRPSRRTIGSSIWSVGVRTWEMGSPEALPMPEELEKGQGSNKFSWAFQCNASRLAVTTYRSY